VLNNFRNLQSLYQSLGARWLMFRVGYALRMRTGFVRRQIPSYDWKDRPLETWLKKNIPSDPEAYKQWRRQNSPPFFFEQVILPANASWNLNVAVAEAERILNGELKYFAHEFVRTGFPSDWHKDPISGIKLDSNRHWSEMPDDGEVDIKFIWEASRFSMVYTLVRAYTSSQDERFAEAFWKLIQSWAESNSPNMGPNWMDGQEAALRLMAWMFGFYAFMDSPAATPEWIAHFTVMVAAHAERIFQNIDYAISTHSNHTISEAFGLWLIGILFPELKDAEKYFSLGRRLLEQEAIAQIFPDGSYAMYSLNYHRFILQIYFYAIRLGEMNGSPFSESVKRAVTKSVDYLYQLIDPETGHMPAYGSNDGALVLPLNNCDFTDYRPTLQLGSFVTKGRRLFKSGAWDEPLYWLYGPQALQGKVESPKQENQSFPYGGVYILRFLQSKAVIHCTDYRARPSHADQLHVDLWWHGKNIACDAGTYLYSGEGVWRNGLAHTTVHNTVIVDSKDQMNMVSRFTWTNWARGKVLQQSSSEGIQLWQGEHNGYQRLLDPLIHKRTVLILDDDRWLVVDHLNGKQIHHYSLHWLLSDFPYIQKKDAICLFPESTKYQIRAGLLAGKSSFSVVRGDPKSARGWRSQYYGHKEPAISMLLETDQASVCFWTYFGFEGDFLELEGQELNVATSDWQIKFDLVEMSSREKPLLHAIKRE